MIRAMNTLKPVAILLLTVTVIPGLNEARAQQTRVIGAPGQGPGPGTSPYYVAPPPPTWNHYTLGVYTQPVDLNQFGGGGGGGGPALAYVQPAPGPGGYPHYALMITSLVPGGAAQRAGLEVGDIIVQANGRPMPNVNALRQALNSSNGFVHLTVRNVRPPHAFVPVPVNLAGNPGGFPGGGPAVIAR